MSAPDDIDPRKLHVEPGKRRRRKARSRPDPKPSAAAARAEAERRLRAMPASPGIMLEPTEHGWKNTSPHNDLDLWEVQLHAAFGTRSTSLVRTFISQLKRLCRQDWDDDLDRWKWNETELNAALALVSDLAPRNAAEAALAAQMVAVHILTMKLAESAFNSGGMVMDKDAALMGKMARTFAQQLEALRLMRGGKRQTIRQNIKVTRETHYHQHSHLHDHRGVERTRGQSDAMDGGTLVAKSAAEPAGLPALPSSTEERDRVVPIARRARKAGM